MLTHEPGGTPLGDEVRRIVLHMRGMSDDLDPRADALLYAAGRAQHVARVIRPALERGAVGRLRPLPRLVARLPGRRLWQRHGRAAAPPGRSPPAACEPDLTILLDVPVEVGLERTRRRAEWNRFEDTEEVAFFERVRARLPALAAEEPERFEIVDGSGSVAAADAAIRAAVERRLLGLNGGDNSRPLGVCCAIIEIGVARRAWA